MRIFCGLLTSLIYLCCTSAVRSEEIQNEASLLQNLIGKAPYYELNLRDNPESCVDFSGKWSLSSEIEQDGGLTAPQIIEIRQEGCSELIVEDSEGNYKGYFGLGSHLIFDPSPSFPGVYTASRWNNPYEIDGTTTLAPYITTFGIEWHWVLSLMPNSGNNIKIEIDTRKFGFDASQTDYFFSGVYTKLDQDDSVKAN